MYRVGVDLGGTNIVAGVIDENNKILSRASVKTNAPRKPELIFDDIASVVKKAVADAGITLEDVKSIGVGTPGSVNKETGYIEFANNLDFNQVPAAEMLKERLGRTIYLDNDANCAALGEAVAGAGNGVKNFVAITLGTGVGSGIIIDGKLVVGLNYAAGEMGHMVIKFDGEQCSCGRRGCWEKYASAPALIEQTKDAMRNNHDSKMWALVNNNIDAVSGRTAFDAMRQGDQAAKAVVDRYISYVACGIINIINALQPDMICIGGGVGHEGEYLLEPLRRIVERERYSLYAKKQTRLCSAVLGNDAGVIGAALLDE
ncbi:MAG: ROK family glucokinase [Clostridiales bacterium]|jgi:glucokinase|nr:ROK family glucokinase [Clostridiales bacterium]HQA05793.1 ROK family glucokinase [Clostridiales bacterium]HQD72341.1 ROK family glucokinase [Clostridiales bacterium]